MEKVKSKNGITLISLVITIIVLLILAGVSIGMLTGDNGLLKKAQEAKEEHKKASAREQLVLVLTDAFTEKHINQNYNQDEFLDEFVKNRTQSLGEIIGDIAIYDGYAFNLDRSTPQLGEYVGKKDELVFPTMEVSNQNSEDKKSATIMIKAKEAVNGINKIEILQDGFVIKEYQYNNVKEEIIENYQTKKNGKYNIKVYSNLTATKTINVDGLITPIVYTPNGNKTYRKEHQVTINSKEKVKNIKYQWTQTTVEPAENTFTETCKNGDIIRKNGITGKWYLWTLLEIENGIKIIERSEVFYFDNTPPEVTLISTPISEASFKLDATGKDAEIGIKKYDFYINDKVIKTIETSEESISYTVPQIDMGEYNVEVVVTDIVGNQTKQKILGRTKMHTWEKWNAKNYYSYEMQTVDTGKFMRGSWYDYTYDFSFNNSTGEWYLSNPYKQGNPVGKYIERNGDRVKYITGLTGHFSTDYFEYEWRKINVKLETSEIGDTKYDDVRFNNKSKYPLNGQLDNYWYVYIGIQ